MDAYQYIASLQQQVEELSAGLLEDNGSVDAETQDEECEEGNSLSRRNSPRQQPLVRSPVGLELHSSPTHIASEARVGMYRQFPQCSSCVRHMCACNCI